MEEKVMKDCKVLALCSQKGGVGKTTSCVNLAVGLAKAGKKVLVIDNDPQGSMTASLGYHNPDELPITLATILTKIVEDELFENTLGILHHQEGIDLIPANIELSGMEVYLMNDLLNAVDRDVIGLQVGVELSYLTVPEQEMVEEVHESTGKYPSLEQAKKIRQHREEKTLTKEIVRLLVIGERKKKTTVTLKQDEIKKYFPPEYDEQKIRTVICQLLEEWSNQNH